MFEPRWSSEILAETERALVEKLHLAPAKAKTRIEAMRSAFPEAAVEGYKELEPSLGCHPKDRHVLAAAITAGAAALVTANLKDFPQESVIPYEVEVLHPEQFLLCLFQETQGGVLRALDIEARRRRAPMVTSHELLASLAALAPTFANAVNQWGHDDQEFTAGDVLPLVAVKDEETPAADLEQPDFSNPLHVAMLWWAALEDRHDLPVALRTLTHHPDAFGDFAWAEELLEGMSIASGVHPAVDDPDNLVFIRFVPEVAQSSRAFGRFVVKQVVFMTLTRADDGTWRVWGLGPAMVSAKQIHKA